MRAPEKNREHSIGDQVAALNVGFMERLRLLGVCETVDDLSEEVVYMYSLEGGHIYTEALGSSTSDLQNPRIIFSATPASRRA